MFKLAQQICYPGNPAQANEDIVGYGEHYCFVMDGASCLSGINVMGHGSDAAWMVEQVKTALCSALDQDDPRPTGEILRQIIAPIRDAYFEALRRLGMHQPDDSPSAGIALFRQRQGRLEFFGLGDCVGVATFPDGSSFTSVEENLIRLDNTVLQEMIKLRQQTGISMLEAKKQCNNLLIANRLKRNCPGGYWILDLVTDAGLENAREFAWDMIGPICVGGFSDGFAQLTEMFGFYPNYAQQFAAMQQTGLPAMVDALCKVQDEDPQCNKYPRFKLRDDTCALWGEFQ